MCKSSSESRFISITGNSPGKVHIKPVLDGGSVLFDVDVNHPNLGHHFACNNITPDEALAVAHALIDAVMVIATPVCETCGQTLP